MSEGENFGLSLAERFFGLLLTVIGIVTMYYTLTSTDPLGIFTGFFVFLCAIPLVLGLILLIAKLE
jgi:hypothetical protein